MSSSSYEERLRDAVLGELALVQDRILLAAKLSGADAKEQIRLAHGAQRQARLGEAAEFLAAREDLLVEHFADGVDIDPAAIEPVVIPVRTEAEADLFRFATLQWSVPVSSGYGRRSRFLVRDRQNGKLMAIFALGDPVIGQAARDRAIGWTTPQRNARLYNVYDAYILGAVEPYRQLLAGKLVALLALSNDTRAFLTQKYAGTVAMRGQKKDPTPALITTSSALGRSSVYNRVTYRGALMLHSVGYTQGYGHFQFPDDLFEELLSYAKSRMDVGAKVLSSEYKSGPNWRFRVLRNALDRLGIRDESLQHNIKREVFPAPTGVNWDTFLRGETNDLQPFDLPTEGIADWYRTRWAIPRAERRPAFRHWKRAEARLTPLVQGYPLQLTLGTRPLPGRIDMGDFHLSAGVALRSIAGQTPAGRRSQGTAYVSRFEGPGVDITIGDIRWVEGEREVRGLDCHDGDFGDLVGWLRTGVQPAPLYRSMASVELRMAQRSDRGRASARITDAAELSARVGFDVAAAMERVCEASVGRRSELLRDDGARKRQLCAVFDSDDPVAPALAWVLTRILPVLRETDPNARTEPPQVRRRAPRPADLQ